MITTSQVVISDQLATAVFACWQSIAGDAAEGLEGTPQQRLGQAIELCIDADRLSMYGGKNGKEADAEVTSLINQHGYKAVEQALFKRCPLDC